MKLSAALYGMHTIIRKALGKSDYRRWTEIESGSTAWESRTEMIGSMISPGSSVIEFGAGSLSLKSFIPASCTYTPSDLVDRGESTIVCDLNAEFLPEFKHYDAAVFSGVLEYVNNVPRLINHLSNNTDEIIASYAVCHKTGPIEKLRRRMLGWVNDFSAGELQNIFSSAGYRCEESTTWNEQSIYRFKKLSES